MMQMEQQVQQEQLLNSFVTALHCFQSAQRKRENRESAHHANHSRRQLAELYPAAGAFHSVNVVLCLTYSPKQWLWQRTTLCGGCCQYILCVHVGKDSHDSLAFYTLYVHVENWGLNERLHYTVCIWFTYVVSYLLTVCCYGKPWYSFVDTSTSCVLISETEDLQYLQLTRKKCNVLCPRLCCDI